MADNNSTTTHDKLYEDALNAINLLFSDNSVGPEKTYESLTDLKGEINIMIQAIGESPDDVPVVPEEEELEDDELWEDEEDEV